MAQRARIVIGLNSGTSADGVDAAACAITGRGERMKVKFLGQSSRKYSGDLRRRILDVMAPAMTRTEEVCRLNTEIGKVFADAAAAVKRRLGLKRVDFIGSHGQTVCHLPPGGSLTGKGAAGTLQLGDAAIIASRMGVSVVHGFRQADMAVGGQGAPLVPWTDWVLLRHAKKNRIVQNIGGIANVTWMPAGCAVDRVMAFDCGPGNMVIDALVQHFTKGKKTFDKGGEIALRGTCNDDLTNTFARHRFPFIPPPKSCGREQFGRDYVKKLLRRFAERRIPPQDWIASATWFTAYCMYVSYAWITQTLPYDSKYPIEIVFCGGGVKNRAIKRALEEMITHLHYSGMTWMNTESFDIPIQAKECVSFAMLAAARMDGVAANLPQVTGAKRRVVLGSVAEC